MRVDQFSLVEALKIVLNSSCLSVGMPKLSVSAFPKIWLIGYILATVMLVNIRYLRRFKYSLPQSGYFVAWILRANYPLAELGYQDLACTWTREEPILDGGAKFDPERTVIPNTREAGSLAIGACTASILLKNCARDSQCLSDRVTRIIRGTPSLAFAGPLSALFGVTLLRCHDFRAHSFPAAF